MKNNLLLIVFILINTIISQYCLGIYPNDKNNKLCISYYDINRNKNIYIHDITWPTYPGGEHELMKYITDNLHIPDSLYIPEHELLQTKSIASFIVDDDGSIKNIQIVKKINFDRCRYEETYYIYKREEDYTFLDKAFMLLLDSMKKWNPGKCNDEAVPVLMTLPVRIHLNN